MTIFAVRNTSSQGTLASESLKHSSMSKFCRCLIESVFRTRMFEMGSVAYCRPSLAIEVRKPFDVLAEGQFVPLSRGNWHSFEPLIAALVDTTLAKNDESVAKISILRPSA